MLNDLEAGDIDAAVLWGPLGGPLVKAEHPGMTVIPLINEAVPPRLFYRITMGVRPNEKVWQRELNSRIRRNQDEINAILVEAGVPLINDMGTAPLDLGQRCFGRSPLASCSVFCRVAGLAAGVSEPDGYRMDDYRARVPTTLAGATVIDTDTAALMWEGGEAAFIDVTVGCSKPANLPEGTVWRDQPRDSIPVRCGCRMSATANWPR